MRVAEGRGGQARAAASGARVRVGGVGEAARVPAGRWRACLCGREREEHLRSGARARVILARVGSQVGRVCLRSALGGGCVRGAAGRARAFVARVQHCVFSCGDPVLGACFWMVRIGGNVRSKGVRGRECVCVSKCF